MSGEQEQLQRPDEPARTCVGPITRCQGSLSHTEETVLRALTAGRGVDTDSPSPQVS
jgi:hypothetical protein